MATPAENSSKSRKVFDLLVKLYCLFFLIATIVTVTSIIRVNDLLANAAHVTGQVFDMSYGAKGGRAPVVRFKTSTGEVLELKSQLYTSPAPNVGDTVRVVYRTSNPRDWQIDDWIHLYFWTLIGAIFMFSWAMAMIITKTVSNYRMRAKT